ncbi:MAG: hypothetical protein IJK44_03355 [Bacteroidales bacterium]|nr:hypothetical protein [Bacteroidales bacterium]
MPSSFKDLRIVDNFLISTLDEEGNTTMGAYSLCFPYYIAGKEMAVDSVLPAELLLY